MIPAAGGEDIKITTVQKNKPAQLVFLVPPDIPDKEYELEVRCRVHGGSELRKGRLSAILASY